MPWAEASADAAAGPIVKALDLMSSQTAPMVFARRTFLKRPCRKRRPPSTKPSKLMTRACSSSLTVEKRTIGPAMSCGNIDT